MLLSHYSRRLSSLATRAICSHLHNKLNVASVVEARRREAVVPLSPPDIPCQCQLQFQHFFSAARPFIPSFFSSVCLAVRSCVFMRSAKAINIVIIATFTSPRLPGDSTFSIHRSPFTVCHSPFVVISRSAAPRIHFVAPSHYTDVLSWRYSLYSVSGCPVLVASCRLNGFHPETLPRG